MTSEASQATQKTEINRLRSQVEQLASDLKSAELRLKETGIGDPITGLFSYRYLQGRVTEEVSRADRFNLEISCLMLAPDQASLEGLLEVARMLKESCRTYDIPARWGQNELVAILPATDIDGSQTFAERFRLKVESAFKNHPTIPGLTVSIGVATYPRPELEEAHQLVESANDALFRARQEGGNRTVLKG
jgi:diguanylate cyclase (GGDEF)-like protein